MSIVETSESTIELSHPLSFTSATARLLPLLLDAGSDGVELLLDALASSDPTENLPSLVAAALLEEPARTLGEEEEADELDHGRDAGQAQHEPTR